MIWWNLIFLVAAIIISEVFRPRPKFEAIRPAGLGDFDFPTAQEGRVVPIVWGTIQIRGPNVIWFGDLSSEAINENVKTGMFSDKDVVVGYRYFLGLQFGICRGPLTGINDGLRRIWIDDKVVYDSPVYTSSPEDPTLAVNNAAISIEKIGFGGKDSDIVGTMRLVPGSTSQAVSAYVTAADIDDPTLVPAYRNTFIGTWEGGEIGNSPNLSPWKFEVTRIPDPLDLFNANLAAQRGDEIIGTRHANPMNVLYEILTDTDWGMGIETGLVDIDNFREVAGVLAAENNGFSMVLDSPKKYSEILTEIERQVDGVLVWNEEVQLYEFLLVRPDEYLSPTPNIDWDVDTTNCSEVDFSRIGWDDTTNQVRVPYQDPGKNYQDAHALAQDMGNFEIQGIVATSTTTFPGVKDGALANQLAWRELKTLARPLAKATIKVNREFYAVKPTHIINLTWPLLGLNGTRFRVTKVDYGDLENNQIILSLVEDVFSDNVSTFSDPIDSLWIPQTTDALDVIASRLFPLPAQLANVSNNAQLAVLAVRANSVQSEFDVYTKENPGVSPITSTEDQFLTLASIGGDFCPSALLDGALTATGGSPVDWDDVSINIKTTVDIDLLEAKTLANLNENDPPVNLFLVDDEIIFFEDITDNGGGLYTLTGCYRGMINTIPKAHSDEARCWFFTYGITIVGPENDTVYSQDLDIAVKVLSRTPNTILNLPATTMLGTTIDRTYEVMPPADPTINGQRFYEITETVGFLSIYWKGRNALVGDLDTLQSDPSIAVNAGSFTIEVWRTDTSPEQLIQTISTIPMAGNAISPAGGLYNLSGFVIEDGSPLFPVTSYRFKLYSESQGTRSQEWETGVVNLTGYGLNYGEDYGGLLTPGETLAQGEAPTQPEPLPGLEQERVYVLTFAGTVSSSESRQIVASFFNLLDGQVYTADFTISGATYTTLIDMAQYAAEQLTDAFPNVVNVSRSGTEVTVTTLWGNISFQNIATNGLDIFLTLEQEEGPVSSPVRQIVYLDFWDEDFDPLLERTVEVLAPSDSANYQNSLGGQVRLDLIPLTYDARKALNFQNPRIVDTHTPESALLSRYTNGFSELFDSLSTSEAASFGEFSGPAIQFTGLPFAQPRPSIVYQADENIRAAVQFFETHDLTHQSGFKLMWKEGRPEQAGSSTGFSRIYTARYATQDPDFAAGQVISLTIGGSTVSETVSAGEAAAGADGVLTVLGDLVTQINGLGPYTAELLELTSFDARIEVRHDTPNTNYEMFIDAGYGLRLEWRQTT